MANSTTNYNLRKPLGTENYNVEDQNGNMDILDAQIKTDADNIANNATQLADSSTQLATGTATAITLAITTLTDLFTKTFIVSADNGAVATTINSKPLYKPNTTTAPNLTSGKAVTVWYNLSSDCFFIKASAEGTALIADVLASKTFSNDADTGLTGTMVDRGTINITPSTSNQPIVAGKHSGSGIVSGDTDLIASNILNTANIFNVQGTAINGAGMNYFATGNGTLNSSKQFTITGLAFTPVGMILVVYSGENYRCSKFPNIGGMSGNDGSLMYNNATIYTMTVPITFDVNGAHGTVPFFPDASYGFIAWN